jgi:hypothetical protein
VAILLKESFSLGTVGQGGGENNPGRRLLQVVTGTFPCGQQMVKYGYKETTECTLCKKAHEESGSSWNRELPKETIGHIQSAGCLGQKEVVIAAHNACI